MNNIFNKPIKELIEARHSVRSYNDTPLSKDIIEKIENYINTVENPFNKKIKMYYWREK